MEMDVNPLKAALLEKMNEEQGQQRKSSIKAQLVANLLSGDKTAPKHKKRDGGSIDDVL